MGFLDGIPGYRECMERHEALRPMEERWGLDLQFSCGDPWTTEELALVEQTFGMFPPKVVAELDALEKRSMGPGIYGLHESTSEDPHSIGGADYEKIFLNADYDLLGPDDPALLGHDQDNHACGGVKLGARTLAHELGHSMIGQDVDHGMAAGRPSAGIFELGEQAGFGFGGSAADNAPTDARNMPIDGARCGPDGKLLGEAQQRHDWWLETPDPWFLPAMGDEATRRNIDPWRRDREDAWEYGADMIARGSLMPDTMYQDFVVNPRDDLNRARMMMADGTGTLESVMMLEEVAERKQRQLDIVRGTYFGVNDELVSDYLIELDGWGATDAEVEQFSTTADRAMTEQQLDWLLEGCLSGSCPDDFADFYPAANGLQEDAYAHDQPRAAFPDSWFFG